MEQLGYYILAASVVLAAAAVFLADRRKGWKAGVNFARQMAHREANTARTLYNSAIENGYTDVASNLNAQAEILRAFEMQLRWEMAARFIGPEKLEE